MPIPFTHKYEFSYSKLETLTPLLRRITARNPSSFTFHGTNTYIIGHNQNVAIIDPGPLIEEHISAIQNLLEGEEVTHIFITHTHLDHSPAAKHLQEYWGGEAMVKTYGYGPHGSGRTTTLQTQTQSQQSRNAQSDEGADLEFIPNITLHDNDIINTPQWTLQAIYTPGHTSNHLCYALKQENALFTGDHVMGWSTSVVVPPDGNMTDYMLSLDKLLQRRDQDEVYWPTHGTCITDVRSYVEAYIQHRLERKEQILKCLKENNTENNNNKKKKHMKIIDMVPLIYTNTDKKLYGAAALSVFASLLWMMDLGEVTCCHDGDDDDDDGGGGGDGGSGLEHPCLDSKFMIVLQVKKDDSV